MDYQRTVNSIADKLNPEGSVTALLGTVAPRGYMGSGFQERLAQGVLRTGNSIQREYSTQRADAFFQAVVEYVERRLPKISADTRIESLEAKTGESFSTAGITGPVRLQQKLREIGFLDALDEVYTTLEIIAGFSGASSTAFGDSHNDLRAGNTDAVKNSLTARLKEYTTKLKTEMKKETKYVSVSDASVDENFDA